jgi:hypothetical protein
LSELGVLLAHFGQPFQSASGETFAPLLNADYARDQYEVIKSVTVQLRAENDRKPEAYREEFTSTAAWSHFFKEQGTYSISEMLTLRVLQLVQALTTSCAERGISTLGQIKTKLRNRMKVGMADALMELKLNGPKPDQGEIHKLLFAEALKLFFTEVKRNPNKAHFTPRPRKGAAASKSRPLVEELESDDDGFGDDELAAAVGRGELVGLLEAQQRSAKPTENNQADEQHEREEERQLEAMYETVGNFGGAPGWTVIHQMPERKAIVLAKSNIKIAHKFSTGAPRRAALCAPLPRSHAARAGNPARPTARMVARQLQGQDAQRGGVQGAVPCGAGLDRGSRLLAEAAPLRLRLRQDVGRAQA